MSMSRSIEERLLRGPDEQKERHLREAELGDARHRETAGRYCIQRSRTTSGIEERSSWLDRAGTNLERAISLDRELSQASASALLELSHMPMYWDLAKGNLVPTLESIIETYKTCLENGELMAEWIEFFNRRATEKGSIWHTRTLAELHGVISELAVLALMHRYSTEEIGEPTWFGLPATLEEDYHVGESSASGNWDIGVYTQMLEDDPARLSYKVQVKSSDRAARHLSAYDDGIAVVILSSGLSDEQTGPILTGGRVISECAAQFRSKATESRLTPIIDDRTSKLLDLLD